MAWSHEEGATAVEYGLIVAAIAGLIAAVIIGLGGQVKDGFCATSSGMSQAVSTTNPNC